MNKMKSLCVGAVLAAASASASASAGLHQICFEGQSEVRNGTRYYKIVVGCSNETGGSCEINARPASGGFFGRDARALNAAYVQSTGMFEHWQWGGAPGTLAFDIAFKDALGSTIDTRPCEVNVGRNHAYGYALSEPAVLTGFSTDASGLVTTGVWRNRSAYLGAVAQVMLPSGFAAVGGGGETADGAFIAYSRRTGNRLGWQVASYTDAVGTRQETPYSTLAYAIGMQIRGLLLDDEIDPYRKDPLGNPLVVPGLLSLLEAHSGSSASPPPQVYPEAIGTPPIIFGSVGLGGEFAAHADSSNSLTLRGQYGITSAPRLGRPLLNCLLLGVKCRLADPVAMAWRAESTDDLGRHPGRVSATFLALPTTLDIGGQAWEVRGGVVRAGVAAGTTPAGTVSGLRGQYALTGIGAELQWRQFQPSPPPDVVSNRLASLQPQAELGGGSVTTRHGSIASNATLDVYGLGIKLVKPGTEPEGIERPLFSLKEKVWLPWLCRAFEGMSGWRGCEEQASMPLAGLCGAFPDLPEYGLCVEK